MKRIIIQLFFIALTQACDSKLKVTVANLAQAPVVSAGDNLDAYSSTFTPQLDIADEDYESIFWAKKSGPGEVFFSDPTIQTPEIYADVPGDYILTVTVTSKRGLSTSIEYTFTWANAAPGSFRITAPANGVSTLKPVISWEQASDFNDVTYTLSIFESDCSTLNQQKSGLTTYAYNLEKALVNGSTYCASVIATDSLSVSTKASNDKEVIFSVNTASAVTLSGSFAWANEASDSYIKFGEEASTNPVATISGNYSAVTFTSLLDETSSQTCDSSQNYDQGNIPLINSINIDGPYSLCAKLQDSSGSTLYIKSSSTLRRDVVAPSITTNAVLDTGGVLADNQIDASEYSGATEIISTDVVPVGADILGYAFVAAADSCDSVSNYKDPLYTNDATITGNGSFKVCTKLEDLAGNDFFGTPSATFTVDRDAPAITSVSLLSEATDSYINSTENGSANAIVSYVGSGYDTIEYEIVASGHTCAAAAATAWSAAVPAANTETTQGAYKICVKASDAMNTPAVMASSIFTIDTTGPTIDAGSAFSANTATALSPSLGDAVSQTWSAGAPVTFSNASLANSTAQANADGPHTLTLTALDAAGNSSTDTVVMTWDTTGPTVNVGSDITIGAAVDPGATAGGDAVSYTWTKQSGSGNITFSSANTLATTISADAQDTYVIRLTVADALGNTAWDELNFTWNTTAVSVSVGGDVSIKTGTEAAKTPSVSGEGVSPAYAWTYSGPGTLTFAPNATTKDLTGITADTEGSYTVTLTVTNTGNSNTGNDSFSLTWDVTAPSVTNVDAAGDIVGGLLSAAERSATNPLINNVTSTGQDTIEYTVTDSGTACSAATGYSGTVPLSNDSRITNDGAYKVCVKATDNAGNTPSYDDSVAFTVDTAAPTSNSISIDADADYDNDGSVDLTLASTGAAEMRVSNASDCSTGSYEAYGTTKNAWALAQTNATAIVYVMFKDSAGNESTCISDTIIHDDQAPTSPTISIAGGADYTATNPVTLTLGAVDASHMYITNVAGCASGGTEEAYATSKSWTLGQTNATATVYVRYRDLAGNWSSCDNDTITHDNTDPTVTITNSGWVNASNYSNYAITGACSEASTSVIIGGTLSGSATCDGSNYTAYINYTAITDGAAAINITADIDDAAGNSATQASTSLGKDIVAPIVAVTNTGWINEDTEGAYNVTGTCTDATSGTSGETVTIGGAASTTVACTGASNFTVAVDYSGEADGTNNISITADISDAAGNTATQSSITVSKDTVDPVITLTDNGNVLNANVSAYTISGTCTDAGSGTASQTVTVGGAHADFASCSSGSFSGSFDVTGAGEGAFNITADISDVAGNAATQATLLKFKDSILPTAASGITLSEPSSSTVRLTYTDGTDTNIGNHDTIICTSNDCATGCSAIVSDANSPTDHTSVASGTYYGCVRSNDTYGNRSAYAVSGSSITLDGTPPTLSNSTITLSSSSYYGTTLSWVKAADDLTTEAQLRYSIYYSTSPSLDTVAEVEAGTALATLQTDINTYDLSNLEPETTYYINVVVYDLVGNATAYTKQTFKTDGLKRFSASYQRTCGINDEGKIYCMGTGTAGFGDNSTTNYNLATLVDNGITAKRFKSVDTMHHGACGLTTDNEIYCWGEGSSGQLGNGASADSSVPVLVSGSIDWRFVSTTEYSTGLPKPSVCGISTTGVGYCWGEGAEGKLGHGSSADSNTPSVISGSHSWKMISTGHRHSCGVDDSGVGYCWGSGADSRLGVAAGGDQDEPQPVQGGLTWQEIHAGKENSCGITTAGAAYCWGSDAEGELGNGAVTGTQSAPYAVTGGLTFRSMDVGAFSTVCAITTDDDLYCWGYGALGALGNGGTTDATSPTLIMSDIHTVDVGHTYACAVKNSGTAFCWGDETSGHLGLGYNYTDTFTPSMVLSGEKWLKNQVTDAQIIEARKKNTLSWTVPSNATGVIVLRHTSAITDVPVDGSTYVATNTIGSATVVYAGTGTSVEDNGLNNGTDYYYSLHSYTSNMEYSTAVKMIGTPTTQWDLNQRIAIGDYGGCAIDHNNTPYCWGENGLNFVGDGTVVDRVEPTAVDINGITNSKEFVHVTVSHSWGCGVTKDDEGWCWGHGTDGNLGQGTGTSSATPVQVPGSWRTIMANTDDWSDDNHVCGIQTDGSLHCWGYNGWSTVGDGTNTQRNSPAAVLGGMKWKSVSKGVLSTCGVTMEGEGLCWGYNAYSQLGDDTVTQRWAPFSVDAAQYAWKNIQANSISACGITYDDKSYCWGHNVTYGELGLGDTTSRTVPTELTGYTFRSFRGGEYGRCAITSDDDLYCWGVNTEGQVGNNTQGTHANSPQFVSSDVYQVAYGSRTVCMIRNDGKAYCWGSTDQVGHTGSGWDQLAAHDMDVPHSVWGNKTWLETAPAAFNVYPYDSRLEVSWTAPTAAAGYVILRHTSAITDGPVDGTSYTSGNTIGSATVAYAGTGTSFTDSSLTNDTIYYYRAYAYTGGAGSEVYSPPISTIAIPKPRELSRIGLGVSVGCALSGDNKLYCWGEYAGNGSAANSNIPLAMDTSLEFIETNGGTGMGCALDADGKLYCWGLNNHGNLGDGSLVASSTPVTIDAGEEVSGSHIWIDFDLGHWWDTNYYRQACALKDNHDAYCWGQGTYGRLGDLTTTATQSTPSQVLGNYKFIDLRAGALTTCGVTTNHDAYCWGYNNRSQLGQGNAIQYNGPGAPVLGGRKWLMVAPGNQMTCGIDVNNDAYCWGYNIYGSLGDGTTTTETVSTPRAVTGTHKFRYIETATLAACGITTADDLYCWGANDNYELGQGNTTNTGTPQLVSALGKVDQVSVTANGACAIRQSDNRIYCWGYNQWMKMGTGAAIDTNVTTPTQIATADDGTTINAVIRSNNFVATGYPANNSGDTDLSITISGPDVVTYRHAVGGSSLDCASATYGTETAVGTDITDDIASLPDGTVKVCVIVKSEGGTWTPVTEALEIIWTKDTSPPAPTGFEPLPGLVSSGIPLSWTASSDVIIYRQDPGEGDISWAPATGTDYTTASDVTSDTGAFASSKIVYVGGGSSATDTSSLSDGISYIYKIFGKNGTSYSSGLQRISRAYADQTIAVGNNGTCSVRNGKLRCWGAAGTSSFCKNGYGTGSNLGDNEAPLTASDVDMGKDVLEVDIGTPDPSSGRRATCALTVEGALRCFGPGHNGRVGNNTGSNQCPASITMADVPLSGTVVQFANGSGHTCAVLNTGDVRCFGNGANGATGYDSTADLGDGAGEVEALGIVDLGGKVVIDISAGENTTCIVGNDGRARCWGSGGNGVLGTDATANFGNSGGSNSMTVLSDITMGVGDPKVKSIQTKNNMSCALTVDDKLRCWGGGSDGRLGNGSTSNIGNSAANTIVNMTDIDVDTSDDTIVNYAVAGASVCVSNAAAQVKCWGSGQNGQLGNGTTTSTNSTSPSALSWRNVGGKGVKAIAAGGYAEAYAAYCVITIDDEIHCWGKNDSGQHGVLSTSNQNDMTATDAARVWDNDKLLLTHYKFEGNANDSSANSRDMTVTGTEAYTTGVMGQAVALSGSDYYTWAESSEHNSYDNLTWAMWVYPDSTGNSTTRTFGQTEEFVIQIRNDNLLYAWLKTGGGWTSCASTPTVATDTWSHLAATYDGSNIRIYINGDLENTCAKTGSISNFAGFSIGSARATADEELPGDLDDARLYEYALSDSDIAGLAVADLATVSGTPVGTDTALSVTVGGTGATHYRYAVITSGSDACSHAVYNKTEIPVATTISDTLGGTATYTLCVIARNSDGAWQDKTNATSFTWTKTVP